ncbi:MAG TPA: sugar phosphate isomerase/epimerase family protein [Planctomycetota bacterium]|nr:sugar phosphate isomerase/epimerase family protein [Planctomycetota bacterium]
MRFAICNELFEGWPLERVLAYCAGLGYDGVEVAPFTLAEDIRQLPPSRARELRRAADGAGISILGLHWLLKSPAGLSINGPDAAARENTRDLMFALIRLCRELGGGILVFGSPGQRSVQEGDTYEAVWARSVEMFRICGEEADRRGAVIALEPLTTKETNFLTAARETARLIQEVDCPAVRLHLDVKAMVGGERKAPEWVILEFKDYLAHFHANDANLRGPGFGDTDFVPIAKALREIGYDGYVSVEVFDFKPDPETIATRSLAYLREAFGSK